MSFDLRLKLVTELDDTAIARLDALAAQHARILESLEKLHMSFDTIVADMARMTAALANIAADIRGLKDQIAVGMTPEQVAQVTARASGIADQLEALAAETPDQP